LRRGQVRHDRGAGIFQCSRSAGCADCSAYAVQTSYWTRGVCVRVRVCFFPLSFFLSFWLSFLLCFSLFILFSSWFSSSHRLLQVVRGGEGRGARHHLILFSFSLFSLSYDPFSIFITILIFTDGIAGELHTAFTTIPYARFPQFSVCIHTSTVTDRVNIALVFSLLICGTWKLQLGNNYKLYQQTNTGWLLCANVFHLSLSWEAVHQVCRISGCARVCCFMVIIDLGQKNWAGSLEKQ
jgi:hypothetical protein